MTSKKFPWKQNLLKVPSQISAKVRTLDGQPICVATAKKISLDDIIDGLYSHLDIRIQDNELNFPRSVTPPAAIGRWSQTNIEGKEVVRKDLPKQHKTFAVEAPNWNGSGTHTVYQDREVYHRDYIRPKCLEIKIDLIETVGRADARSFVFRFAIDEVLSLDNSAFDNELLYNLNILQENVGSSNVFPADTPLDEFAATVQIDWEILPVGERDANIRKILSGTQTQYSPDEVRKRYIALERLKPIAFIRGTSGFNRYFGAQFSENLVAFENLNYGNALYLMFHDWKDLCQRTRLELLSGNQDGFERIIHSTGWQAKLSRLVKENRK